MKFERFVALRYLTRRKGLFAIITTLIGVAGVSVGVAALITTLSVMNGVPKSNLKTIRAPVFPASTRHEPRPQELYHGFFYRERRAAFPDLRRTGGAENTQLTAPSSLLYIHIVHS